MERNSIGYQVRDIEACKNSEELGKLVEITDDLGEVIGQSTVYDNPSKQSAIGWANALNVHILLENPDNISMNFEDKMININRERIQELRKMETQLRMESLMGIAFKAMGSTKVAVTHFIKITS